MADDPNAPLNADPSIDVVIDTATLDWTPSPAAGVSRKRLHRAGPAESGQVTSVVRYAPGARFPAHDHPEGEEILVLDGVFSDEHGDWPAGTYLLNPEGFRHAPHSREGCEIFVKLRQAAEPGRIHVALATEELEWQATNVSGIESKPLYVKEGLLERTQLERWEPGTQPSERVYADGVEIFVLEGGFSDARGRHSAGSWLRLRPEARLAASTARGCTLFIKTAGVSKLRSV